MLLRILFLAMLCIPFLYLFFILAGYLMDDMVNKSKADNSHDYVRSDKYYESSRSKMKTESPERNRRKFRVIR